MSTRDLLNLAVTCISTLKFWNEAPFTSGSTCRFYGASVTNTKGSVSQCAEFCSIMEDVVHQYSRLSYNKHMTERSLNPHKCQLKQSWQLCATATTGSTTLAARKKVVTGTKVSTALPSQCHMHVPSFCMYRLPNCIWPAKWSKTSRKKEKMIHATQLHTSLISLEKQPGTVLGTIKVPETITCISLCWSTV